MTFYQFPTLQKGKGLISTCGLEAYGNLALVHFFSTVAISLHLAYNQVSTLHHLSCTEVGHVSLFLD
jgi:hypothetical protein